MDMELTKRIFGETLLFAALREGEIFISCSAQESRLLSSIQDGVDCSLLPWSSGVLSQNAQKHCSYLCG